MADEQPEWEAEVFPLEVLMSNGAVHGFLLVAERGGPFRHYEPLTSAVGIYDALTLCIRAAEERGSPPRCVHVNPPRLVEDLAALAIQPPVPFVPAQHTPLALAVADIVLDVLRADENLQCLFHSVGYQHVDHSMDVLWCMDLVADASVAEKLVTRLKRAEAVEFREAPGRSPIGGHPQWVVVLHGREATLGPLFVGPVSPTFASHIPDQPEVVLQVYSRGREGPPKPVRAVRLAHRALQQRVRAGQRFREKRETWPNPGLTLMDFVRQCGMLRSIDDPLAQRILEHVAQSWRAAVEWDFVGDRAMYDALMATPARDLTDIVVREKRQRFPADPRVFETIEIRDGDLYVCEGIIIGSGDPSESEVN